MTLSHEEFGDRSVAGLVASIRAKPRNRAPVVLLKGGREWNPLPIAHSGEIHRAAARGDDPAQIAMRHAEYRRRWG